MEDQIEKMPETTEIIEEVIRTEIPPTKTVYQCNDEWFYVGETTADKSPLEEDVWLIPAYCVEIQPPPFDVSTHRCKWTGSDWFVEEIPVPPPPPPPSRDEIIKQKTAQIMLTRDKHNAGGVFAFNHWWPTVLTSIPQWNYLRDMARETKYDGGDMDAIMTDIDGNPFSWQTLDNGDVSVTANMVIGITDAGARNINKNSQNAKRHIANLNASENPEDYDFSDGWTEIYQA